MSLVFAIEPVEQVWNEVMVLANLHWTGTKSYRRHYPFQPSFDRYRQCNESGFFQLFTARHEGRLVGYFGTYLSQSMHSQHLMATEDVLFLHPDYRKGRNAIKFIRHIEMQCQRWGVKEIMFSCEDGNPTSTILEYLDYVPVIRQFSKQLSSPNAIQEQQQTEAVS